VATDILWLQKYGHPGSLPTWFRGAWIHWGHSLIDTDNPDERLVRLAYLWARSYALRAIAPADTEYDVDATERVINNLEREFRTLKQLKDAHTPIKNNIIKAQEYVEEFEENIDTMLEELRGLITPDNESD